MLKHQSLTNQIFTVFLPFPFSYWPDIDDALRSAAFNRKVQVRLLASYWNHTWGDMMNFLKSLDDIGTHYSQYPYVNVEVVSTGSFEPVSSNGSKLAFAYSEDSNQARGYKTFFTLHSSEHEISIAHKN